MTKSTGIPRHILKVIFLMVLNLQKCFSLADADAHFLPESQIISTIPQSHSLNFGKHLADPLATSGTEFRTLTSVRGRDGNIFQGTTTYGRTGRWVGRAYPVFEKPSSSVVSAAMIVRGGVTNPNVYNPYGINQGGTPQRRPSSRPRPVPPFLPPNNFYTPYGTPQYFTRYNPYFNRPVAQGFDYVPVGHVRRFNRPANTHILYREVDPSYLIFGNDIGTRAFFLENNPISSTIAKRKTKKEDFFSLSNRETLANESGNSSEALLSSEDSVSPSNQLFTFFSQDDSKPIYTDIDPEPLTSSLENNGKSLNTTDFIPITFITTTQKPKGSATFTFGSFNPKPSDNPATGFVPINFIPSTPTSINTFTFDPLTTTRSPKRQGPNSIPEEIDLEDIDRTISDIIRIIPARRRGNTTRNDRRQQSTRPPRHPEFNPEGFPGLHPPQAPTRIPEHLPPDRPEVDDDGWTIIKPRFRGTIRRTNVDEPPGRIPEHVTDVEFFTDTPEIRKPSNTVIDKSFELGSREELITPGPSDEPMTSGKALSAETTDEGSSTTSIREHGEMNSFSPVGASFSATTLTSVITTGVFLIQRLTLYD